jgi:hypothetical protein
MINGCCRSTAINVSMPFSLEPKGTNQRLLLIMISALSVFKPKTLINFIKSLIRLTKTLDMSMSPVIIAKLSQYGESGFIV